jgi:methionyl aminopeptidase
LAPTSTHEHYIKTPQEIEKMRVAGRLTAEVLDYITPYVKSGITTGELDRLCHDYMVNVQGCIPAPLNYAPPGYKPYPKSICTSVNHQVCHGVPGDRQLKNGDIVNLDVTVIKDGYHGDSSRMFQIGETSVQARRLCEITFECLWLGIVAGRAGAHLGDIGHAIQKHAEKSGYSVVREFCGHGIGAKFPRRTAGDFIMAARTPVSELEAGMIFHHRADDQCRQGGHPDHGRWLDDRHQGSQPVRAMGAHHPGHRNRLRSPHRVRGYAPATRLESGHRQWTPLIPSTR